MTGDEMMPLDIRECKWTADRDLEQQSISTMQAHPGPGCAAWHSAVVDNGLAMQARPVTARCAAVGSGQCELTRSHRRWRRAREGRHCSLVW